jgi:hypothetical protein
MDGLSFVVVIAAAILLTVLAVLGWQVMSNTMHKP